MHRSPLSSSRVNARHHHHHHFIPVDPIGAQRFRVPNSPSYQPPPFPLPHTCNDGTERANVTPIHRQPQSLSIPLSLSLPLPHDVKVLALKETFAPASPPQWSQTRAVARATVTVWYHVCKRHGPAPFLTLEDERVILRAMLEHSWAKGPNGQRWVPLRTSAVGLYVCRHIHSLYRFLSALRLSNHPHLLTIIT